jgi:hypothetical protein
MGHPALKKINDDVDNVDLMRVAQAFDLAGTIKMAGTPFLRVFLRRAGVGHNKSNSARSIAAHPCKKRKDGAPSVGMVHAKIVKGGPPAA